MKKIKYLLLPLLLLSATSCSSTNKYGYKSIGQDAPLSFYEAMVNDKIYSVKSYSTIVHDRLDNVENLNFYGSGFATFEEDGSEKLFSLYLNAVIQNELAYGFDSVNESSSYKNIYSIGEYIAVTVKKGTGYNFYVYSSKGEEVIKQYFDDKINLSYDYISSNIVGLDYSCYSKQYSKTLVYDDKTIILDNNVDNVIEDGDKVKYLINKISSNNYYVSDLNGDYVSSLNFDFDLIDDFDYLDLGDCVYYFRTSKLIDSVLDYGAKPKFKTSGYKIDYTKGSVEYSDSLPFEVLSSSYSYSSVYVEYKAIDENGYLSNETYGTVIDKKSKELTFDKKYLFDNNLKYSIKKLSKDSYLVCGSDFIYVDAKQQILLKDVVDYYFSGKKVALGYPNGYMICDAKNFISDYKKMDRHDGYFSDYGYNGEILTYYYNEYNECVINNYSKIDDDFCGNLLYDGLIVKGNSISTLDGNKFFTIYSDEEFSYVDYYDYYASSEDVYYYYEVCIKNDSKTKYSYFTVIENY